MIFQKADSFDFSWQSLRTSALYHANCLKSDPQAFRIYAWSQTWFSVPRWSHPHTLKLPESICVWLMPSQVDFSPVFHINLYQPGRKVENNEIFNGWFYSSWCVQVFCGSDIEVSSSSVPLELSCLPLNLKKKITWCENLQCKLTYPEESKWKGSFTLDWAMKTIWTWVCISLATKHKQTQDIK